MCCPRRTGMPLTTPVPPWPPTSRGCGWPCRARAADLTVLGHSYGGSIVGSAEAHGMVVDRVVHISSAGGYVSDVHDYAAGECGTHRFSMTDPDDPIQLVQGAGFSSAGQVEKSLGTVAGVLPAPLRPLDGPVAAGLARSSPGTRIRSAMAWTPT